MSYQNRKSAGERSVGLIFVVVFHVLLVWGLASGLAHDLTAKVSEVIQTKVVEEDKPEEVKEPPPPPPDTKIPPPDFVPPPSFDFVPDAGPTTAIQAVTKAAPPAPKAEPAAVTKPKGKASNTKPDYPQASIRAGEEGVVGINIYVNEDGRVGEVKLEKSSGFERLDEAVLKHVKRAWKFTPCMQGETPVACWYPINLKMQIKQE
ncbi:MAG TPA: energy transducer TonB [Cellvibrio sp.]|nr:energy transducer TonB [Cellvibrio sp.]